MKNFSFLPPGLVSYAYSPDTQRKENYRLVWATKADAIKRNKKPFFPFLVGLIFVTRTAQRSVCITHLKFVEERE